jgi:hypothetical protein
MLSVAQTFTVFCQRHQVVAFAALLFAVVPPGGAHAQSWYSAANVAAPSPAADIEPAWPCGKPVVARDDVEQRITILHDALRITAQQEAQWRQAAQAIRDNAASLTRLLDNTAAVASGKIIELADLPVLKHAMHDHGSHFSEMITSFDALYAALPDGQKKLAVHALGNFGAVYTASHG